MQEVCNRPNQPILDNIPASAVIFQPIRFICAVCLFFIFADDNYALVVTDSSDYLQGDASTSPVPVDPKPQESPEEVNNV